MYWIDCVILDILMINLYNGDCLEVMKNIPNQSVDMILCDLPYGTVACSWDVVIPFDKLWEQYERIINKNSTIVLTASQPFTTSLINSNIQNFKYCWVWEKSRFSNQMLAKKQPLKIHEDIVVFSYGKSLYNPPNLIKCNKITKQGVRVTDNIGGGLRASEYIQTHTNYPKSIQKFNSEGNTVHPTQKPVELMQYMIKTYTNENGLVLDNCMGSGTTGVAAKLNKRNFIGIEKDENYFNIAKKRIDEAEVIEESSWF